MQVNDKAGRRLSVITIDQIVSAMSNVSVALLSAHLLGVAAFGYFGLVLIIVAATMGLARSLVGDPVLVHPDDARQKPGEPIAAVLVIGTAFAALLLLVAGSLHLAGLPLAVEMFVLAVSLPGLLLHDLGRYLGFATQRPTRSLALDLLWLLLVTVAMVALVGTDTLTLTWFVAAWGGTGALASLLVLAQHGLPVRGALAWLRDRWFYSWRFLLSYIAMQGAALSFSVVVAAAAGARALGAVRGAQVLIGPYITFQTAAAAAGVSEVSNEMTRGSLTRHLWRTSAIAFGIGLVNGVVLLLLPDVLGRALLADTWDATKQLLVPTSLHLLGLSLVIGPRSYLIGSKLMNTTVRIDVAGTILIFAAGIVGVLWDGALGAFWGVAAGQWVCVVLWWLALRRTRVAE